MTGPLQSIDERVSEATTVPAEMELPLHHEMAYMTTYPKELVFFCEIAATHGGETPLCDSRQVAGRMDDSAISELDKKKLVYHRYMAGAVQESHTPYMRRWRDAYDTESRADVEANCHAAGETIEWDDIDGAMVGLTVEPLLKHPVTGDRLLFVSGLGGAVPLELNDWKKEMRKPTDPAIHPMLMSLGDETMIPTEWFEEFDAIRNEIKAQFSWQPGDVLLVDNLLCAHGRNPYEGERSILVALR